MRRMWAFAKREYVHFFVQPTAYAVVAVLMLILGLIFVLNIISLPPNASPNLASVNSPMLTLLLFITPVLTMRLLADEQRSGTMELLLTGPIREWELVVGKWLGAWLFGLTVLLITGVYPLVLTIYGNPDLGVIWAGYVGLALVTAAFMALGVLASALTSNVVVAVALGYGFLLGIWLIEGLSSIVDQLTAFSVPEPIEWLSQAIGYLSFSGHYFNSFHVGVLDTSDATFFISLVAIALYAATRVVESRRWR